MSEQVRTCDVCQLVDGDDTPKPVNYCPVCDAWICTSCAPNIGRRARAMFKRGMLKALGTA